MRIGRGDSGLVAFDPERRTWVAVDGDDPIALLADPPPQSQLASAPEAGPPKGLPFHPRSFRAFSIWEEHMISAARVLAARFYPPPARHVTRAYERITRRPFPKFKPPPKYYERPLFYMGNHTSFYGDGEDVPWPRSSKFLDLELELGMVITKTVRDATPEQGLDAIGGFLVVNDWSARDVQADEHRRGVFGPVVKSKSFANSMGAAIVSTDEVLSKWDRLQGRVRVDGELWCEGTTANAQHGLGDMVAYASADETLAPGDLLSTGTLPGCCGLELDRWLRPGQRVEMEIDGVGTLANRVVG